MRAIIVSAVVLLSAAAYAQTSTPPTRGPADGHWRAQSWDDAVATLPCAAFVRKPKGQWTMPGRIDLSAGGTIENITFGPDNASKALDVRCGTGQ